VIGGGEGMDELLAQMQRLQSELADAEAAASERAAVGSSGGGLVRVEISGDFSFDAVHIDPSVAQGDVALLEDLVLAALRDGAAQLIAARDQAMGDAVGHALGSLFGGEGLGLGGADEPGEIAEIDAGEPEELKGREEGEGPAADEPRR
jgi:nucleoid-associated protein EbfC